RVLWIACFPCTDIWTEQAGQRGGRLRLDRGDANAHGAGVLSALFLRETKRTGKPRLMQALAANSFRVEFLHQVFPDAKFIHVVRNGLSVAQEIAQRGDKQGWWGRRGYKWQQIAELASRSPDTAQALALCENNFDRGLLEWRMSIEAIESARTRLPNEQFLEIRYEDIAERPSESLERAREFIGLADDALWERRALALMRRSHEPPRTTARQKDLVIGGAVLKSRLV
ncbi:MAG TPA: sulfotransferase, partial [Burkholderiales bacterium]|nr:sulfotransferase [Burkholderiales bacterium]